MQLCIWESLLPSFLFRREIEDHKSTSKKQAGALALQVRQNRGEDKAKLTEGSLTPFRIVLSGLRKLQILTRWIKSWCLTSSRSLKMFIDKKERKREREWVKNYSLTSEETSPSPFKMHFNISGNLHPTLPANYCGTRRGEATVQIVRE